MVEQTKRAILRNLPWEHPWRLFGFGFYQAWVFLVVLNPSFFAGAVETPFDGNFIHIFFNVTLSVGLVALMLTGRKILYTRRVLFSSAGISAVGTLLFVVSMTQAPIWSLLVVGIVLTGFGNAVFILSWGQLWTKLDTTRMGLYLMVSYISGYALCSVLCLLPVPLVAVIAILLPFASSLMLDNSRLEALDRPEPEQRTRVSAHDDPKPYLKRFFWAIVIISLIYGSSKPLTTPFITENPMLLASGMAIIFLILFFVTELFSREDPFIIRIYRVMFASLTVGFVSLPFMPKDFYWISVAIIACGARLLNQLVWLTYPEVIIRIKDAHLSLFGWASVCIHVFTALGALIGSLMLSNLEPLQSTALTFMSVLMVMTLIFLMIFFFKEKDFQLLLSRKSCTDEDVNGSVDPCDEIAEHYALSAREIDVLKLLANGRTVPFVAKELFMSQSTVKTHIKHIYNKMGIHNRQELHDLIENFPFNDK